MLNDETVPADNSIKSGENYTEPASDSTDELREQLAAIEHERWADWQAWSHKILRENCPSPELEAVLERWDKQIATPYDQLSPKEQASDMEQVDRYWSLITRYIEGIVIEARLDEVVWYSNQVGILHKPWDKYEVMRKTALREQRQRLANPARTDKEGETA
jgi:hypothetical protein